MQNTQKWECLGLKSEVQVGVASYPGHGLGTRLRLEALYFKNERIKNHDTILMHELVAIN